MKGGRDFKGGQEIIRLAMKGKLKDNNKPEGKIKRLKSKLVSRIGKSLGQNSRTMRMILQKIRKKAGYIRKRTRDKIKNKERLLIDKYRRNSDPL